MLISTTRLLIVAGILSGLSIGITLGHVFRSRHVIGPTTIGTTLVCADDTHIWEAARTHADPRFLDYVCE